MENEKKDGGNKVKVVGALCAVALLLAMAASPIPAAERYEVTCDRIEACKAFFDDPRPLYRDLSLKTILPAGVYAKVSHNAEAMKEAWSGVVGFKAPEVVGRIAPEFKPGTYSYLDKPKHPGLKELMIPLHYDTFFNPGGEPHAGNFPEVEVIPTRQYYYPLPVAEATKRHMGTARLNEEGYLIPGSYEAGLPFPNPSGRFKARQILYNWEKRHIVWDNSMGLQHTLGFNGSLKQDYEAMGNYWVLRLQGRRIFEPYGWYDERARKSGEARASNFMSLAPRDLYGNVINSTSYTDPEKADQMTAYINSLRRTRKLSGTDLQDRAVGQDIILEDYEGFDRKLSPRRYPWVVELADEREYLVPALDRNGSTYYGRKGVELKGVKLERRPLYVVMMTQTDPNYIYRQTVLYIDRETFLHHHIENYDRSGRLFRTVTTVWTDLEETGMHTMWHVVFRDYVGLHSNIGWGFVFPAPWVTREHVSLQSSIIGVK